MSSPKTTLIQLTYGDEKKFSVSVPEEQVVGFRSGPRAVSDLQSKTYRALKSPLDYPPVNKAILPDDNIALVVDTHTPGSAEIVAAVWQLLSEQGIAADQLTIIQPYFSTDSQLDNNLLSLLPETIRNGVEYKIHNPEEPNSCSYLTVTTSGDQIYLAREVIEADFVISIGQIAFDALLGFRGTNSVFYPGLSRREEVEQSQGQGHLELNPHDLRPLRQQVDEVGWLLGTQFAVQVIPSAEAGVFHVLAGEVESVMRTGKQLLEEHWMISLAERTQTVVLALDSTSVAGSWAALGSALATARRLVHRDGRIVILSDISEMSADSLKLIRDAVSPGEALKSIRMQKPADSVAASQVMQAAEWASIFWLSRLNSDLVEDLFMTPLANEQESSRLLKHAEKCLFLGSAEHTYGCISVPETA